MSETIGFFTAWGNQDWAPLAVANHLKLCDKIFISVEAHHKLLLPLRDHTYSRLKDFYGTDKRVTFFPQYDVAEQTDHINRGKCAILNKFIECCRSDDVLMICDSDEFYDDNAIKELKEKFKDDEWDILSVADRMFCVNMDWFINTTHRRFIRNKPGSYFSPTQSFHPRPYRTRAVCSDNPMFHYSLLQGVEFKRLFWKAEEKPIRKQWLETIYLKWRAGDKKTSMKLAEENYILTGHRGFWFHTDDMDEADSPFFLHRFYGKHPQEIEKSRLRKIKDFRRGVL